MKIKRRNFLGCLPAFSLPFFGMPAVADDNISNLPVLDFDESGNIINLKSLIDQSIKIDSIEKIAEFGEYISAYIQETFGGNLETFVSYWENNIDARDAWENESYLRVYSNKWVINNGCNGSPDLISGEIILWLKLYRYVDEFTVRFCKLPESKIVQVACKFCHKQKIQS